MGRFGFALLLCGILFSNLTDNPSGFWANLCVSMGLLGLVFVGTSCVRSFARSHKNKTDSMNRNFEHNE